MQLMNNIKVAIKAMLHPSTNTKAMSIENVLRFYYKVSLIPLALAIVVNLVLTLAFGYNISFSPGLMRVTPFSSVLGVGISIVKAIGFPLLYLLILIPLGLLLNAAIYQLFSKLLFDLVKRDYNRTLTAYLYAEMPCILLFWLFNIPIAGLVVLGIASIWSIVVLVISLSKQQGINVRQAIGTWLLSIGTLMLIVMLVVFAAVFSVIGIFGGLSAFHAGFPSGFNGLYNATLP